MIKKQEIKNKIEHKLNEKSVKPTAMRTLVLKYMLEHVNPVSLADLDDALDSANKSTLFRTLKTFEKNNLVHTFDDGTGKLKYALCTESCDSSIDHQHFHFNCIKCGKTFCLSSIKLPAIELPLNFKLKESNLVLKGYCSNCS